MLRTLLERRTGLRLQSLTDVNQVAFLSHFKGYTKPDLEVRIPATRLIKYDESHIIRKANADENGMCFYCALHTSCSDVSVGQNAPRQCIWQL